MSEIDDILEILYELTGDRQANPVAGSYTNYLLDKGLDLVLTKISEQTTQLLLAAKNGWPDEIKHETADLLYHLTVLLYSTGVTWKEIADVLQERRNEDA